MYRILRNTLKKPLELINNFSNVAEYKSSNKNQLYFCTLSVNNPKKKIKKNSFIIA